MASKKIRISKGDVLIDVDVQPTFMPGGGLAVAGGHEIVPVIKRLHQLVPPGRRFATLDRHPRGHISLASSYLGLAPYAALDAGTVGAWTDAAHGIAPTALFGLGHLRDYLKQVRTQTLWPDHAIEGTPEAELHPWLDAGDYAYVVRKGLDPLCDSYSGFRDNLKRTTGLAELIGRRLPATGRVILTGLAYDFCVGWTALDAVDLGFEAVVVKDATRPVGLPGTVEAIEDAFRGKGVQVAESFDLSVV